MSKELKSSLPTPAQSSRDLIRSFEALLANEAMTKAVLLAGLERKSDGVILLSREGSVMFLNDTARAVLEEGDGLTFIDGQFVTSRLPETRRVEASIRKVLDAPEGEQPRSPTRVLVTRPSGRAPFVLSIASAPEAAMTCGGGCVVHVIDLAAQALLSKGAACEAFGLSDREADLAVELTRGLSLKDAAAQAGMAVNTARNHMHSIFAKCGVHSQVELSRMLTRLI